MAHVPIFVLVFSGKRKSGKDFVSDRLQQKVGQGKCAILRLSGPLKEQYAKEHGLDFEKLLDATDYKEKYREDMIRWGEAKRNEDPSYFCSLTTEREKRPVWIISDARRLTDMEYFKTKFGEKVIAVRVVASSDIRQKRGWLFTEGVDDAESECGLDAFDHDVVIENNSDLSSIDGQLKELVSKVEMRLGGVS
ncbi:phosphomevalonate kinase-like [Lineus longissimus]|uniref:phosphomevalonate kinase-like n=1 Tax=Lineus longissimus TaxID=88925 RepID=UPI002B4F3F75